MAGEVPEQQPSAFNEMQACLANVTQKLQAEGINPKGQLTEAQKEVVNKSYLTCVPIIPGAPAPGETPPQK